MRAFHQGPKNMFFYYEAGYMTATIFYPKQDFLALRDEPYMTDGASSDCPLSTKDGHVSLAPTEGL